MWASCEVTFGQEDARLLLVGYKQKFTHNNKLITD